MEEHRLLSHFLDSNVGKVRLKTVSVQVIPRHVTQTKTWRKFTKHQQRQAKYHFGDRWKVTSLIRNMPLSFDREFRTYGKSLWSLCLGSSQISRSICLSAKVVLHEVRKRPEFRLKSHNRTRNLALLSRTRNKTALLSGCHFQHVSEIQEQLLTVLHVTSKFQLQQCIQQSGKCWTGHTNLEGNYSEGENDH
jgi:hypothetical protein